MAQKVEVHRKILANQLNVIDKTGEKTKPPKIPKQWDFTKANKNFDVQIQNWRRLTGDVLDTLWIFYNKLSRIEGRPKKTSANALVLPSWNEWTKSKGIGHYTAERHFRRKGWLPPTPVIETPPLPKDKYRTIVIDPPWPLGNEPPHLGPFTNKPPDSELIAYWLKDCTLEKSWPDRQYFQRDDRYTLFNQKGRTAC